MESYPRELIARIPPFSWNWTLKGGLSMRSRILAKEKQGGPFDAAFFNQLIPAIFLNEFRKRVPSIIAMDATPPLLDLYGKWYDVAPASKVKPLEKLKYNLTRKAYLDAKYLMPCSNWVAESLRKDYGIPDENIHMTPEGINLAKWAPPQRATTVHRTVRVLFIGSDFIRKGGDLVLNLAAREEFRSCEFHFLSYNGFRPMSENVIIHSNIRPNTDDLKRLYEQSDIFVLPSRGDLSPVVILEAMAMELPVISTNVGGIRELVGDGVTGFVIPPDDEETLASRLRVLVSDGSLRRQFGKEARITVERRFNLDRCIGTIIDHLKKAANGSRGGRMNVIQAATLSATALDPALLNTLDHYFSITRDLLACP
jgi:glycosyltransferase involved in cell wall biosynthesis